MGEGWWRKDNKASTKYDYTIACTCGGTDVRPLSFFWTRALYICNLCGHIFYRAKIDAID